MKLSESMRLAAKLIDAFPHVRLDDESAQRTLKIYAEYLQDLDFGEAEAAVSGLLATARFFPTIAEIRGAVAEAALDAPSAEEAWAIVQRETRRVGSWGKPEFGDPRIAATVAGLGWRALCASDKPGVDRAHFRVAYLGYRARAVREQNVGPLLAQLGVGAHAPVLSLVGERDEDRDSEP